MKRCILNVLFFACSVSANQVEVEKVSRAQIDAISESYLDLYRRVKAEDGSNAAKDRPEANFVARAVGLLKNVAAQIADKKDVEIGRECFYFDLYLDVLNEKLLSAEEWSLLKGTAKHIAENCSKDRFEQKDKPFKGFHMWLANGKYSVGLGKFVKFVDENKVIRDKDTIVAIGNTPQLQLESLRFAKKDLRLVSVALSKWPGFFKGSKEENAGDQVAAAIVTPQGLRNYQKYLNDLGLTTVAPPQEKHRLFFIDLVGTGFGLEFVIVQVVQAYLASGQQPPEMHIIALDYRENPPEGPFVGKFLKVDRIVYNEYHMEDLLRQVDAQESYNLLRITPNFPAGFWHAWLANPRERPYYSLGTQTQKAMENGLEAQRLELNAANVIVH